MSDGWVKIHRKFLDWEWYDKSEMVHLFLHLLLNASSTDKQWRGTPIKRGQVVTGRRRISEDTGLSEQKIRTCLQRLVDTGEIVIESTTQFSVITICNYESYQMQTSDLNQPETNKEPTVATQEPIKPKKTNEEVKAETSKRMKAFYNSLIPFVQTYGKEMVREFYDYWSETNKSGSKMRWEQEKTWVLEKRLQRWANNDKLKSKNNGTVNNRNSTAETRAQDAASVIASLAAEE